MRTIDFTGRFKRDFKRAMKGQHGRTLEANLRAVITLLVAGTPLPANLRDHASTGNLKDHRDCHLRPDLVLIYRFLEDDVVQLVRIGSHSELDL